MLNPKSFDAPYGTFSALSLRVLVETEPSNFNSMR